MLQMSLRPRLKKIVAPVGLGVLLFFYSALPFPQGGLAKPLGVFAGYLGNWRGSGHVTSANGGSERISCRASYSSQSEATTLSQTLVCASDSYRFDIRSFLSGDVEGVEGHWEELTRNVTGHLSGRIADGQFDGTIVGSGFTAAIVLRASARRQTIVITPQGGGDIARVEIVLSRGAET
jgi:hypothetical protein